MDGSFAKDERIEECYAREALKSKDVDILDYHYYGSGFNDNISCISLVF